MKKESDQFLIRRSNFELRTSFFVVFAVPLFAASCRTTRLPAGQELAPLNASTSAEAAQQLASRRAQFSGERSLVRLHFPRAHGTVTARAQLQVDRAGRLRLTIYTPLGTTAARLYAAGDQIVYLNDLQFTAWQGSPSDFGGSLGLFGTALPTEAVAFLMIGLPPLGLDSISYSVSGMSEVRLPEATIAYDPPSYPPKGIRIDRGGHTVGIDHLESYADSEDVKPLTIPRGYRCCVLPRL